MEEAKQNNIELEERNQVSLQGAEEVSDILPNGEKTRKPIEKESLWNTGSTQPMTQQPGTEISQGKTMDRFPIYDGTGRFIGVMNRNMAMGVAQLYRQNAFVVDISNLGNWNELYHEAAGHSEEMLPTATSAPAEILELEAFTTTDGKSGQSQAQVRMVSYDTGALQVERRRPERTNADATSSIRGGEGTAPCTALMIRARPLRSQEQESMHGNHPDMDGDPAPRAKTHNDAVTPRDEENDDHDCSVCNKLSEAMDSATVEDVVPYSPEDDIID